jgi:site-specific DNA-cytosine methylase
VDVLVACERSGRVRDAFLARGHNAWSCDTEDTRSHGPHIKGDVTPYLQQHWDLVIAFPPCTHLSLAGNRTLPQKIADGRTAAAVDFFMACYNANAPRVCVENPKGVIPRYFRKPDQYIEPWMFGDPYRKKTGLWLRGLPILLNETSAMPNAPIHVWAGNKTKNGDRRTATGLRGTSHDVEAKSQTFPGIARAMAEQWG